MNRVLQFLHPYCPACNKIRHMEAVLAIATDEARRIETLIGNPDITFWIPDAARVLKQPKPEDDDDDAAGIRLILGIEPRLASIDEPLADFAVTELRRIASELWQAANRVEFGDSKTEGGAS
jgi:hypothetical protein